MSHHEESTGVFPTKDVPRTEVTPSLSADQRLARYECLVHPSNLASDYGTPVSVLAATIQEARDRAIALGWTGRASDARVLVLSVSDE